MTSWSETLDSFRTARESWDLLHSHDSLENGNSLSVLTSFCFTHPDRSQQLQIYYCGFFFFNHVFKEGWKVLIIWTQCCVFIRVQEDLCLLEDRQLALVQNIPHWHDHIPGKRFHFLFVIWHAALLSVVHFFPLYSILLYPFKCSNLKMCVSPGTVP